MSWSGNTSFVEQVNNLGRSFEIENNDKLFLSL